MNSSERTKLITAKDFCDLQGVQQPDEFVIMKRGVGQTKTYDEWHDQFFTELPGIGDKKPEFTAAADEE